MSPIDPKIAEALDGAPKLVVATVAIMEELARVLMAEIDLVAKKKVQEHIVLLKHKQKLAIDYRSNMRALAERPDVLKTLPDDSKDAIRDIAARLAMAGNTNARILHGAVEATRQLVQNIMAAVKKEAMPKQNYINHTKAHLQLGTRNLICKPIAVCRTV